MALEQILRRQDQWARSRWANHTGRRAPSLDANLFFQMEPEVREQFTFGNGSELGRQGKPGKMWSVRSSSALSYNFFAPWNGTELSSLAEALSTEIGDRSIRFEQKFRHGLRGIPPNIDVVFDSSTSRPLGVECKFSEPYGANKKSPPLDEKYFAKKRKRWREVGLPRCQELAEAIGSAATFVRLDASQLLKHMLGLARVTKAMPRLRYVWYDAGTSEAIEHSKELRLFQTAIDSTVDFKAVSYQELFQALESMPEPRAMWRSYMSERYFGDVGKPASGRFGAAS
jgi:hypothetical protein